MRGPVPGYEVTRIDGCKPPPPLSSLTHACATRFAVQLAWPVLRSGCEGRCSPCTSTERPRMALAG